MVYSFVQANSLCAAFLTIMSIAACALAFLSLALSCSIGLTSTAIALRASSYVMRVPLAFRTTDLHRFRTGLRSSMIVCSYINKNSRSRTQRTYSNVSDSMPCSSDSACSSLFECFPCFKAVLCDLQRVGTSSELPTYVDPGGDVIV